MLATANRAKAREMAALLLGIPFRLLNLADFPGVTLPPEGESSYAENALAKARAVAAVTGEMALADDSGIEVDALGGGPGVLSARYGGPGLSDPERCEVMLREMASVPREKRTARFRCLIAIVCPRRRRETTVEGVVEPAPGCFPSLERPSGRAVYSRGYTGVWRSSVAHLLWEQGVGGSNPLTPTIPRLAVGRRVCGRRRVFLAAHGAA